MHPIRNPVASARRSVFVVVLAGIAAGTGQARAEMITLQPDSTIGKDAYITDASPTHNNGDWEMLIGSSGDSFRNIGLIEFDLGSIPSGSTIHSAHVSVYHVANDIEGNLIDVFRVTSAWDESTVRFSNAPSFDETWRSSMVIPDDDWNVFRDFDVTYLVQGWVDGSFSNHGMWIEQYSSSGFFTSSDWGIESQRPLLAIEFTPSSSPVPEPSSLALLGTGLFGLIGYGTRRWKSEGVVQ